MSTITSGSGAQAATSLRRRSARLLEIKSVISNGGKCRMLPLRRLPEGRILTRSGAPQPESRDSQASSRKICARIPQDARSRRRRYHTMSQNLPARLSVPVLPETPVFTGKPAAPPAL